jgi:hypothetical protein
MRFLLPCTGIDGGASPYRVEKDAPKAYGSSENDRVRLLLFLDKTQSAQALRPDCIRYAVQAAVTMPAGSVVEACTFGSDVRIAPFFEGPVRRPAAFAHDCQTALTSPSLGRGSYGAPLLKRIRERLARNRVPTVALLLTDGGFDDLPHLGKEAGLLARERKLLFLAALPVVASGNAYTRLEEALAPLGERARLAARNSVADALREMRDRCRAAAGG